MKRPSSILVNHPLAPLSGYGTGGQADFFLHTDDLDELQSALSWAIHTGVKPLFLGGGTNMLIPDGQLQRLVLRWTAKMIEVCDDRELSAGAGAELQEVVNFALRNRIKNFSWAAGLPGTVGAAVRGNAGAFGGDMSSLFVRADYISLKDPATVGVLDKREMRFSYRSSVVKEKEYLVLKSVFMAHQGSSEEMQIEKKKAEDHLAFRAERHPLEFPNCGSVFKNIDDPELVTQLIEQHPEWAESVGGRWNGKVPAGAIIEAAHIETKHVGAAVISDLHSNFIINRGGATSTDIHQLIRIIAEGVQKKFGIHLEPEIQILELDG